MYSKLENWNEYYSEKIILGSTVQNQSKQQHADKDFYTYVIISFNMFHIILKNWRIHIIKT